MVGRDAHIPPCRNNDMRQAMPCLKNGQHAQAADIFSMPHTLCFYIYRCLFLRQYPLRRSAGGGAPYSAHDYFCQLLISIHKF